MKAVDSHRHCLEPFFDVIPLFVVELTAQLVPKAGSQIATSIDQKLGGRHVVILGESMQERRRRISPAAAVYVYIKQ